MATGKLKWLYVLGIGFTGSTAMASAPNLNYDAPRLIQQPGTYTGNYRSTNGTPAVEIYTDGEVILENCNLVGPGPLIRVWSQTKLTVRNCNGFGEGNDPGHFIQSANLKGLIVENNYMENVSKGVLVYQFRGQGGANESIHITRNLARNIRSESDRGSFIQFNQVIGVSNVEIAYNQVINQPGLSAVEDNINLFNSSGTAQSPISIHDNFIEGAYPRNLAWGFTGTGMTSDGDGNPSMMPGYIEAKNNSFISTCNAAMNIAGGHHIRYHDNRMVTSSMLPDGSGEIPVGCTWAATAGWNNFNQVYGSPLYTENSIDHNVIGFVRGGIISPFTNRQDISPGCSDGICHDNIHLPNPINLDSEKQEWNVWNQKLNQSGVTIGSTANSHNGSTSLGLGVHPYFTIALAPTPTPSPTATPTPEPTNGSWQLIGYEGDSLGVDANTRVRYGINSAFVEKTISGSFSATNDFFGNDPYPGVRKEVQKWVPLVVSTPTPTPSPSPVPTEDPTSGNWVHLGWEGDWLEVPVNSKVRYGTSTSYLQKSLSGGFFVSNDTFGGDPAYGTRKEVWIFQTTITWVHAGYEYETITVAPNTTVRYGANGQFVSRVATGTFTITNDFFGSDPAPGVRKEVLVPLGY